MSGCRHCGNDPVNVAVTVPARLSHDGKDRIAAKPIDHCIWRLVAALNENGVLTAGACCGHGDRDGEIVLHDDSRIKVPKKD